MRNRSFAFGFQVFRNRFAQGSTGPSFANVNSFDDWTMMDDTQGPNNGMTFEEHFEKINGTGSFTEWQQADPEIFSSSYDEVWAHVPWLSSPPMDARK